MADCGRRSINVIYNFQVPFNGLLVSLRDGFMNFLHNIGTETCENVFGFTCAIASVFGKVAFFVFTQKGVDFVVVILQQ